MSLFTPFTDRHDPAQAELSPFDDGRCRLDVSDEDLDGFDALPRGASDQSVTVTDRASGTRLRVRRADCGAGCYCAAEIVEIIS